jgi:hypothetical protein
MRAISARTRARNHLISKRISSTSRRFARSLAKTVTSCRCEPANISASERNFASPDGKRRLVHAVDPVQQLQRNRHEDALRKMPSVLPLPQMSAAR